MPNSKKPTFVFPYHDPNKNFNKILLKNLPLLQEIFGGICISATPSTVKLNGEFLQTLADAGCMVYRNKDNTHFGDHFRNGLRIYQKNFKNDHVYFGFIDRVLFVLETKFRNSFIKDVSKKYKEDLITFSRTKKAWQTHPRDYYIIENIAADAGKIFFNKELDWFWCGAMMSNKLVAQILDESKAKDLALHTEFVLINFANGGKFKNIKVDWQAWEDPFWAKKEGKKIKKNLSEDSKIFRLNYIANSLKLFAEYKNKIK